MLNSAKPPICFLLSANSQFELNIADAFLLGVKSFSLLERGIAFGLKLSFGFERKIIKEGTMTTIGRLTLLGEEPLVIRLLFVDLLHHGVSLIFVLVK